jgi:hypothetical protein
MAVTVSNLILGPANLYVGAFGAAEPTSAQVNTLPPVSAWTDLGATQDGVTLTINQDFTELEVDQVVDIPGRRLTKRELVVKTNLAEATLANLALLMNNQSTLVTAAATNVLTPAFDTSATQPTYNALIIDGWAANGKVRRVIARRVLSVDNPEFSYKKDGQAVFTVSWSAHYVSPAIAPFVVYDQIT